MLDIETKSRINTARDILVGKVPDPKSQVEQITIALIYKFMDDMDVESEELGGKRTFFTGEYAKYAWRKIFDPRQSGYDLLNLYSEAIAKMDVNPGIPKLFRDIFKNAYLPYRDPETLKSFLKIINEFDYSHSEKLGDAFEFLLSILGSQGEAGQFRTPRHIIDFMVEIVDPKKNETILDPACGTAGFLISSYKHIIKQNSSNYKAEPNGGNDTNGNQTVYDLILSNNGYTGDKLSAEERKILADNMHGYDISPDMVRLSLVNMYLHGIKEPHISENDTLTSEDNWNHYSDVILANPPFMSPKGGIKPHKMFSVQSNRSEVLFVDYIAEHLTPEGRAAVIVPEGIIFQSGNAYKQLRKMLVEKYLVGVISLPAGVFQPYSGVKTSILWLDKVLAKKTDKILFVKIENDGFDLGAQRRAIKENDLPDAIKRISNFKEQPLDGLGQSEGTLLIKRDKISLSTDYNLSGDRYRPKDVFIKRDIKSLRDVCEFEYGYTASAKDAGNARFIRITDIDKNGSILEKEKKYIDLDEENSRYLLSKGDIIIARTGATYGKTAIYEGIEPSLYASFLIRIRVNQQLLIPKYLWALLQSDMYWIQAQRLVTGGGQPQFNANAIKQIQIPIPSLSVQEEIVSELDSYQKIIDGARMVVENYKPRIDIDPEWEMVEISDIAEINRETINPAKVFHDWFRYVDISSVENATGVINFDNIVNVSEAPSRARRVVKKDDILLSTVRPNLKAYAYVGYLPEKVIASTGFAVLTCKSGINSRYLFYMLFDDSIQAQMSARMGKGSYPSINEKDVSELVIPLPPLSKQQEIVSLLIKEEEAIKINKELIMNFEKRIKDRIAKVWGE